MVMTKCMKLGSFLLFLVTFATLIAGEGHLKGYKQPLVQENSTSLTRLSVGVIPILDILPLLIAEQQDYFKSKGIEIELVLLNSAHERDTLFKEGKLDGILTDLISVGILNGEGHNLQVISLARAAYSGYPQFRVIAAPHSTIRTAKDLCNVEIGISKNSIIEYIADRLLLAENLTTQEISTKPVNNIIQRFTQLMMGELEVAILPDPIAQHALDSGARLVVDDASYPEYSASVLSFSLDAIKKKPEAIQRFVTAWNLAALDLNRDPEKYRRLLVEAIPIPEKILNSYVIPRFPLDQIPTKWQWEDVVSWLMEKRLIQKTLLYNESVNKAFVTHPTTMSNN